MAYCKTACGTINKEQTKEQEKWVSVGGEVRRGGRRGGLE